MPASHTGITFANHLTPTESLNTYVFRNFYNGGGVAIGDLDRDGLADIVLTGNQVSNRVYLNRGGFRFEDVTESAGLLTENVWTTGVSMVDVNGDGWLDLHLSKSGPPSGHRRANELLINRQNGTFEDQAAAYGLAITALSIHTAFLDYDGDRDLDAYLLSNPVRSLDALRPEAGLRDIPDPAGGNRLLRNDPRGFTDVTEASGVYSSAIGFGLGVSAGDLNRDGWPDLYVSNDFFERDYLYLNRQDGYFVEVGAEVMPTMSLSSMGGDIADLNNDGLPEVFVSDMLPELAWRYQSRIAFPDWDDDQGMVHMGYHHQATRNTLQLNRGSNPLRFSEVARLAGIDASDWSWGALVADFDLDGYREVFVPNGIYKDLLDQDFIRYVSNADTLQRLFLESDKPILRLLQRLTTHPLSNFMYVQRAPLEFENVAETWGLGTPSFSSGAAYGDLDNDGDLDLVVNNVNMPAFVYRNRAVERYPERAWIQLELQGRPPNTYAVGAQATIWAGGAQWFAEQHLQRGFLSSVDPVIHVAFVGAPDSVVIQWPQGERVVLTDIAPRTRVAVTEPR